MYNIKKLYILLLICLILSACSEKLDSSDNDNLKSNIDNKSISNYDEIENNYTRISENIVLEKDISSVEIKDKDFNIIPVKIKSFDFDKFSSMLFNNTIPIVNNEDSFTTYTYEDKELIIYEGSITYKTSLSNYINEIIITDDLPSKNIDNFKKDSLEFMTKRQAIDKATEFLDKLEISYLKEPKVYALDVNTLIKEQDLYQKEIEQDDWFKEMQQKGKIKLKDEWKTSDECYYLFFDVSLENTKIYPNSYTIQESNGFPVDGSKIEIMISQDGIIYCDIGVIYEKINSETKHAKIISLDDMLDIVSEKYNQIILENPITIKNISLQYCVVPTKIDRDSSGTIINQEFEMVPAWILNTVQTVNARGKTIKENIDIIINAQTGDFIE